MQLPPEASAASDQELLARLSAGDETAIAALVSRHHALLYRVVWRMTGGGAETEDIVQESILKLWRNPSQVRDGAALRAWLMRVATNAAIDRGRKPRAQALDEAPDVADTRPGAQEHLEKSAAAKAVERAMGLLPERQRLALTLVYFEGLTNIEAAAVMEATVEAVESLLARARRALRESLSGEWRGLLDSLAGT